MNQTFFSMLSSRVTPRSPFTFTDLQFGGSLYKFHRQSAYESFVYVVFFFLQIENVNREESIVQAPTLSGNKPSKGGGGCGEVVGRCGRGAGRW